MTGFSPERGRQQANQNNRELSILRYARVVLRVWKVSKAAPVWQRGNGSVSDIKLRRYEPSWGDILPGALEL